MSRTALTLEILVDDQRREISVEGELYDQAAALLDEMDADMSRGWQRGRHFIARPDTMQRCQIVANRLLTALHTGNQSLSALMSSYILSRLPGVASVI